MSTDHVINPEAIAALRAVSPDDDGKFLTELIDIFLADTPPRLDEISRAVAAQDANSLMRAAHSIKGSAGNFGAERVARHAAELEKAGKEKDFATAAASAAKLSSEYAAAKAELEALRAI